MPVQTYEQDARRITHAIWRESFDYLNRKPNRIPPADSPTRPQLARLWVVAFKAANKRRKLKTFTYCGCRYGVIYLGYLLCVLDWRTRRVLVRPPLSMTALGEIIGNHQAVYQ